MPPGTGMGVIVDPSMGAEVVGAGVGPHSGTSQQGSPGFFTKRHSAGRLV